MARNTRGRSVPPVRPTPALAGEYQGQLEKIVDGVHRDVSRLNLRELEAGIHSMAQTWLLRMDAASRRLASWFATRAHQRTQHDLRHILREGGWTVRFAPTPVVQSAIGAIVTENVSLIKSIPQKYLSDVATIVQESVEAGGDLKTLTDKLQQRYGVTRRRAVLIAHDQNSKATAMISRVRQQELGIEEGIWVHSHAGNEPRPTHVKAGRDKVRFKLSEGWYDPAVRKYVWPGSEINCRCVWKPVLPGDK